MRTERFSVPAVQIDSGSVYRYMRSPETPEIAQLVASAVKEAETAADYKVCYMKLPMKIEDDQVTFGTFPPVKSRKLADHLKGCPAAVLFCATCGVFFDRKIAASRLSPVNAVIWDAVGTAAIEQLCDDFCEKMQTVRSRFSPGYGDLPLTFQSELLSWLDASCYPGVGLTDSLLMTPTKSVTAIAALESI